MLYPIIFKPIYKEMICGGTRLTTMFDRNLLSDKVMKQVCLVCLAMRVLTFFDLICDIFVWNVKIAASNNVTFFAWEYVM